MGLSPSIWYEALASEVGIIIQTDNPDLTRQRLYAMRKSLNDPDLESISIQTSPTNPGQDLWLVKRKNNAPQGNIPSPEGDAEPSRG